MLIPEDPDILIRVKKYADFVAQGKIVIKTPVVSRNGSKNVSGHDIAYDGDNHAYKVTPRVYWQCDVDGTQHSIRIKSKEFNLDIEEWLDLEKELNFPLTDYAPDFLHQMSKEELFIAKFSANPFWVLDLRKGYSSVKKQAEAYKSIKRMLMAHSEYLKLMGQINAEWDRCYEFRQELLSKFLNDDKQNARREKEFIKRLIHFLSGHDKFVLDIKWETLEFMLSLDPELLKDVGRFIKRNQHDIPHMKSRAIEEAVNKAKVGAVLKS